MIHDVGKPNRGKSMSRKFEIYSFSPSNGKLVTHAHTINKRKNSEHLPIADGLAQNTALVIITTVNVKLFCDTNRPQPILDCVYIFFYACFAVRAIDAVCRFYENESAEREYYETISVGRMETSHSVCECVCVRAYFEMSTFILAPSFSCAHFFFISGRRRCCGKIEKGNFFQNHQFICTHKNKITSTFALIYGMKLTHAYKRQQQRQKERQRHTTLNIMRSLCKGR